MRVLAKQENYNKAVKLCAYAILNNFRVQDTNNCWLWLGSIKGEYGNLYASLPGEKHNRSLQAHRLVYTMLIGPVSDQLVLDHLCRNTYCVNPFHLEVVTERTNILRGRGIGVINSEKTHCPQGHPLKKISKRRYCQICTNFARDRCRGKL